MKKFFILQIINTILINLLNVTLAEMTGRNTETKHPEIEVIAGGYSIDHKSNTVLFNGQTIDHIDADTLQVYLQDNYSYAKDKNAVYYQSETLKNIDSNTFEVLNSKSKYTRDTHNVFYDRETIINADSATFIVLSKDIAQDKNVFYYKGEIIPDLDPQTAQLGFFLDFNFIISNGEVIDTTDCVKRFLHHIRNESIDFNLICGVDIQSFQKLNNTYAKDKNYVYRKNFIIKQANPKTFENIDNFYIKDKNYVYYNQDIVKGADPANFVLLDKPYAKDQNYIYYNQKIINGADPATFILLDKPYAKDQNYIYYNQKIINGADPATFILLDKPYIKDTNAVFYQDKIIENADPKTFQIINLDAEVARDKSHIYLKDQQQPNFDVNTFITLPLSQGILLMDQYNIVYYEYPFYPLPLLLIPVNSDSISLLNKEQFYYFNYHNIAVKSKDAIFLIHRKVNAIEVIKLKTIDIESFKVIDEQTAKDKNGTYSLETLKNYEKTDHYNIITDCRVNRLPF